MTDESADRDRRQEQKTFLAMISMLGMALSGVVFILAGDYSALPATLPTGDEVLPIGYIGPILMFAPLTVANYIEYREAVA